MKHFKIVLTSLAENDIKIASEWYNSQQKKLGNEFLTEIEKSIQFIQSNPKQFTKIKKDIRKAFVKRFPFGIYYFVKGNVINIFAVIHFSRNPKIWKQRIK